MLRRGILHNELNHVLASMGHGDILIVCDAGFPIPRDAWRVELAITKDYPDLVPVLEIIANAFISEKVMFAHEVPANNAPLYRDLQRIFAESAFEPIEHSTMLTEMARKAKAIVRTGGYNPWGNIALVSGTDPFLWFTNEEVVVPAFYQERIAQIKKARGE
jgi:D-ribose pyranose/furanose isomerase RbsD